METPPTVNLAQGDSVTAGISRSGRVRKKSSKLLDFQSPDELEKKPKRAPKPIRTGLRGRPPKLGRKKQYDTDNVAVDNINEDETNDEQLPDVLLTSTLVAPDSEDELDELVADLVEGVEAESLEHANNNNDSKVRQSLYMTEKASKRKFLRDGRVIRKLERKDKGKSRYTAYSMWAREFRKTSKFSKNQDFDLSNSARRLGELWANVSNKEKNIWRRKAKLEASKVRDKGDISKTNIPVNNSNSSALLNRTTTRTKKLGEINQPKSLNISETTHSSQLSKRKRSHTTNNTNNSPYINSSNLTSSTYNNTNTHNKGPLAKIEVIDTAAHLKLLGESLTIIGERLKEHEGQIAVSGSLSVLLDSLLCSLGPLLCLTTKIPGLEQKLELSENLSATLDNIAYVMPGL